MLYDIDIDKMFQAIAALCGAEYDDGKLFVYDDAFPSADDCIDNIESLLTTIGIKHDYHFDFIDGCYILTRVNDRDIFIQVYADSCNLFTEEECDKDNMADVYAPENLVKIWYEEYCADNYDHIDFEQWMKENTLDDFIDFIDFARNKGMNVSRINNTSCVVIEDPEQYANRNI